MDFTCINEKTILLYLQLIFILCQRGAITSKIHTHTIYLKTNIILLTYNFSQNLKYNL